MVKTQNHPAFFGKATHAKAAYFGYYKRTFYASKEISTPTIKTTKQNAAAKGKIKAKIKANKLDAFEIP